MIVSRIYMPEEIVEDTRSDNLGDSAMMRHLLQALQDGTSIGDFGRLTFVMVARYFMDEQELVSLLARQPELDEESARALVAQIQEKDYIPPTPEIIQGWQAYQDFPIYPNAENPDSCDVYLELRFPKEVYSHLARN